MLFNMIQSIMSGNGVNMSTLISGIFAMLLIIFLILPLHECAHGWVALKLGDSTAKYQGRLTLDPIASMDPMGTLCLLLFGYGWAKPVPVDSRNFKNPKRDMALTALAGPLSNLIAALVGALVLRILVLPFHMNLATPVWQFFSFYIGINVSLAVFNLLPIPPLDGSKIVGGFLSSQALYNYYKYQNVISLILIMVLFMGFLDLPLTFLNNLFYNGINAVADLPFRLFGFV